MFHISRFTAINWLKKVKNSAKPKHFTTVQLTEILATQEIMFSQQHVFNPSALQGMTITILFLLKSISMEKHFHKSLHVIKTSL